MSKKKKSKAPKKLLGIDIGGSGIKGAPVHAKKGELLTERHRIPTPQPATPEACAETVQAVMDFHEWTKPVGLTVPGRVVGGVVETAANIDDSWKGVDAEKLFRKTLGVPVTVLNDADAAGIAEVQFGAGRGTEGTVLLLTFGTGIGSALFTNGHLVRNTELGHVHYDKREAEHFAADSARSRDHLSWERWAKKRVQPVLEMYEFLFAPDLLIIGGGVSKPAKWKTFGSLLKTKAKIVPAALGNEAGIVGAAYAARRSLQGKEL
ncbi:polyphosphate--glucose phosphotransferase [Rubrivirga litoralis]|uniref:ROK family protein n=1 Tax=Rubrivirga litoralis TaxID=3075598 RepID=A0ABU3BV24_9BACT|nr:ROK family protein [Rubrivirga sp. F394]MDT0633006.1 ROK family protein [Rubrivirga sp. F394]